MYVETTGVLFSLLKMLFCNEVPAVGDKMLVDNDELLDNVITLASGHDIAHLIALSILNNDLSNDRNKSSLQNYALRAFCRHELQDYEFGRICELMEQSKIPFIPLKGSVLKAYYPETWWRTSCDIDILVEEQNLRKAIAYLTENLKYTERKWNSHDVMLASENGICLELHFYLGEEGRANSAVETLKNVWEYATPKRGWEYRLEMSDDMFYYYHIAHMAEHFETGGCGIRPFIDLWILDNLPNVDFEKRNNLLIEGNLFRFANNARKLSKIWLADDCHDETTMKLEKYIITGGVYGNVENNVKVQQVKKGNKHRFFMSKIFLPAVYMERIYPSVKNRRWLLPFMQVCRWIAVAKRGISDETKIELKNNRAISWGETEQMQEFLEEIGL